MAIKTFAVGEVLTASDTNTYLANSGLVYVAQTTFAAAATVQFTNVFNSTYSHYRSILQVTGSTGTNFYIRLLVGTTPQTGNILSMNQYNQYSAASIVKNTRGDQYGLIGSAFSGAESQYIIDWISPFATALTSYCANGNGARSTTDSDWNLTWARNIVTTSMNGFEITTAGAPTLAGTLWHYGVRNV